MQYDAFLSYRRSDGTSLAQWLRQRLVGYRLPRDVGRALQAEGESPRREARVFLDTWYERPSENFLEEKILPALRASRRLVVTLTPDAFIGGAEANWMQRELAEFLRLRESESWRRVILVRGPGVPATAVPEALASLSHDPQTGQTVWDSLDCSMFSARRWIDPRVRERLDEAIVKLAADVLDVPDAQLPVMSRHQARRRRRMTLGAASSALAVVTVLAIVVVQTERAKRLEKIDESRDLASEARFAMEADPVLALERAAAAWTRARTGEAESALRLALMQSLPETVLPADARHWFRDDDNLLVSANREELTLIGLGPEPFRLALPLEEELPPEVEVFASSEPPMVAVANEEGRQAWLHDGSGWRRLSVVQRPDEREGWVLLWSISGAPQAVDAAALRVRRLSPMTPATVPCRLPRSEASLNYRSSAALCRAESEDAYAVTHEDGNTVIDGKDGIFRLLLGGHQNRVFSAAFSPDGDWLATASTDGTTRVWAVEDGRTAAVLTPEPDKLPWVAFSPGGRWLITPRQLWPNTWSGKDARCSAQRLTLGPQGRWLVGTTGESVSRLSCLVDLQRTHWNSMPDDLSLAHDVEAAFTPDGLALVGISSSKPEISIVTLGEREVTLPSELQAAGDVMVASGGRLVLRTREREIALHGPKGIRILTAEHQNDSLALDDSRRLLMSSGEGHATLHDLDTGAAKTGFAGTIHGIEGFVFDPDGRHVVTWEPDRSAAHLWSISGEALATLTAPEGLQLDWALSDHGVLQAVGPTDEGSVYMSVVEGGELVERLIPQKGGRPLTPAVGGGASVIATSPTSGAGTLAAVVAVTVRELSTGQRLIEFLGHDGDVTHLAFSADGGRLATLSTGRAIVYDCPGCVPAGALAAKADARLSRLKRLRP